MKHWHWAWIIVGVLALYLGYSWYQTSAASAAS
jgi:hypothetical protein